MRAQRGGRKGSRTWKNEDIAYIRSTIGQFTIQQYAEHFGVSEHALRNILLRHFSKEDQLTIRAVSGRANFEAEDIICPYYTKRLNSGINCDKTFGYYITKNRISAFIRNHCAKYYHDEQNHCPMREMLNHKWEMKV